MGKADQGLGGVQRLTPGVKTPPITAKIPQSCRIEVTPAVGNAPVFGGREEKMIRICLIAASSATALVLAFALSPASARSCNDDATACGSGAEQASPMKLDEFMSTWKPAGASKHTRKKSRTARVRRHGSHHAAAESKSKASAPKAELAAAKPEAAAKETAPSAAATAPPASAVETTSALAAAKTAPTRVASADETVVTGAVPVKSFSQANEIDAAADQVQVVPFNEINELDLAAPPRPLPAETFGQSAAAEQPAADTSWIGKLLVAAAGTIALAGAARLLVA
jgi:hypothetical protein